MEEAPIRCPRCGTINLPTAEHCDCGDRLPESARVSRITPGHSYYRRPLLERMGDSWLQVLLRPRSFFETVPVASAREPILFALFLQAISMVVAVGMQQLVPHPDPTVPEAGHSLAVQVFAAEFVLGGTTAVLLIRAGVLFVVSAYLFRTRGAYSQAMSVVGFARAPLILTLVPWVRWPAVLYSVYLECIGVQTLYRSPFIRAALAVALSYAPILVLRMFPEANAF